MTSLPLANLTRHKLRSAISVLGIGVGIALFVLLPSLADGMIGEVASRMQNVDADLMVYPRQISPIFDLAAEMATGDEALVAKVEGVESLVPVAVWRLVMAGQRQRVFGVRPKDLPRLGPDFRLKEGRPLSGGEEMVIDSRLARAGGYRAGQTVRVLDHDFTIAGVAATGLAGRVVMPLATVQRIVFNEDAVSFFFVKCKPGVAVAAMVERFSAKLGLAALPLADYNRLLEDNLKSLRQFLRAVSVVALVISFFVVLLTMYTAVVGRTREIGILKSLGAGYGFILREVLTESIVICVVGAAVGSVLSWVGGRVIEEALPLVTVEIGGTWIGWGFLLAVVGGVLGALYPGWVACRMDAVRSLSYE